jgi:hypothetical protein
MTTDSDIDVIVIAKELSEHIRLMLTTFVFVTYLNIVTVLQLTDSDCETFL